MFVGISLWCLSSFFSFLLTFGLFWLFCLFRCMLKRQSWPALILRRTVFGWMESEHDFSQWSSKNILTSTSEASYLQFNCSFSYADMQSGLNHYTFKSSPKCTSSHTSSFLFPERNPLTMYVCCLVCEKVMSFPYLYSARFYEVWQIIYLLFLPLSSETSWARWC